MTRARPETVLAVAARALLAGARLVCRAVGHGARVWWGAGETLTRACGRCGTVIGG